MISIPFEEFPKIPRFKRESKREKPAKPAKVKDPNVGGRRVGLTPGYAGVERRA